MSLWERLVMRIWCIGKSSDADQRLNDKLNETMLAATHAVSTARGAAAGSASDRMAAELLTHEVRGRIAQQDVRRHIRAHDPRLAVIQDTVRILEERA